MDITFLLGVHSAEKMGRKTRNDVPMETHPEQSLHVWLGHNFTHGISILRGNL